MQKNFTPAGDAYTKYVLLLIFLVAVFNTCDRTIVAVLVDDIKVDLLLNDRQIGFILGMAFAVTNAFAAIPIARLSDKWVRRNVIVLCLSAWSFMTVLAGLVQNYGQMVLVRMGVGLGEAGASPASHSLITDYVAPKNQVKAMSIVPIGGIAGLAVGAIYGGWAAEAFGWRWAMITVGVPGIFLALLVFLTLREPPRRASTLQERNTFEEGHLIGDVWQLFKIPAFSCMVAAVTCISMVINGRIFWDPTFLRRVYGLAADEAGIVFFITGAVPAALGAFLLASVTDKLAQKDVRWYAWVPAISIFIMVPLTLIYYFLPTSTRLIGIPVAYFFGFGASFCAAVWTPVTMTLAQAIVPVGVRALAVATLGILTGFIGAGIGPWLVGDLNVRLAPMFDDESIRYSLSLMSIGPLIAIIFYVKLASYLKDFNMPAMRKEPSEVN